MTLPKQILGFMHQQGTASAREILDAHDARKETIYNALRNLVNSGRLVRIEKGYYGTPESVNSYWNN